MKERGIRIKLTGVVLDSRMDKTAVVLVDTLVKHKTYSKYIRRHSKYLAHDPDNKCQPGDRIRIIESRPISKRKRWKVADILEKGETARVTESAGVETLEQEK